MPFSMKTYSHFALTVPDQIDDPFPNLVLPHVSQHQYGPPVYPISSSACPDLSNPPEYPLSSSACPDSSPRTDPANSSLTCPDSSHTSTQQPTTTSSCIPLPQPWRSTQSTKHPTYLRDYHHHLLQVTTNSIHSQHLPRYPITDYISYSSLSPPDR